MNWKACPLALRLSLNSLGVEVDEGSVEVNIQKTKIQLNRKIKLSITVVL